MEAAERKANSVVKQVDHPLFNLQLRSDGIVQMNTDNEAYFTLQEAKEYLRDLETLTEGVPRLVLKVPGEHAMIDSEARSFMATPEALKFSIAEAVIVKNMAQRIIGNFYIKFDKPDKPVRLFDNIEDAEFWLSNFR